MKTKHWIYLLISLTILSLGGFWTIKNFKLNHNFSVGQKIDSLNSVFVIYNGSVDNVTERNTTDDGYNLGLKYQCVEFVKRYYYEHLNHKMPDSYGHAKDFFDNRLADGTMNVKRNLTQFTNPSATKPKVDDLIIFDQTATNPYGHVAIISKVSNEEIEIIQQNPGRFKQSRVSFAVEYMDGKWKINDKKTLGWLRKE